MSVRRLAAPESLKAAKGLELSEVRFLPIPFSAFAAKETSFKNRLVSKCDFGNQSLYRSEPFRMDKMPSL